MNRTRRIPARLKKRLETNLQNLSVEEAGRLMLIYTLEADKKNHEGGYPPLLELWDAWQLKVSKSRGKEEEPATVAAFNALVFLQHIISEANQTIQLLTAQLVINSLQASKKLDKLLLLDAISEVARMARGTLEDYPKPVSRDDYRRLLAWAEEDLPIDLGEEVNFIVEEWARLQGFTKIEIPVEDMKAKAEETGEDWREYRRSDEDFRREWAEVNNLLATFGGDEDRLEEWVQSNEYVDHYVEFSRADLEAKTDELFDNLVARLEAGKLEGGEGIYPPDIHAPLVLLRDGKLPALVALRAVWPQWVAAQDLRIKDFVPDPLGPQGIGQIYDPFTGEKLDRPALVELVGKFVKECKGRSWGEGLADLRQAQMKPEALLDLLIQEGDPFLYLDIDKPDWGMIDFEGFAKTEKTENGREYEAVSVATIGSLQRAQIAPEGYDWRGGYYEDAYFPTKNPKERRRDLQRTDRLLATLQLSDRAVALEPLGEDTTVLALLGSQLANPIEDAVAYLQYCIDEYVTLRTALDRLSERYFGGLPVLLRSEEDHLQRAGDLLEAAKGDLAAWLEKLAAYPWSVDTSPLQLRDPKVNEENAKEYIQDILETAKYRSKVNDRELAKVGLSYE